jgi:preprotein translocase subunit SecD
MTGDQLKSVSVVTDKLGNYEVSFELKDQGASIFATHTANNIDKYLTLVLDKTVISSPVISAAITDGSGVISGKFTAEEANALAVQLRYGSLPIAMKIVEDRTIGPTLGKDSLDKSLLAGVIGFFIVVLFMIIFYRVPGVVAIAAIIIYGLITFTLYKFIPVTLTLPGIAGLLLSTGGALDANILIFERMKEELRSGRNLKQASELGWKRAWSSIRDSNLATLITSGILFWFGSSFGATIVKGFAVTLALGVIISLFAATFITRTLLSVVVDWFSKSTNYQKWFGA